VLVEYINQRFLLVFVVTFQKRKHTRLLYRGVADAVFILSSLPAAHGEGIGVGGRVLEVGSETRLNWFGPGRDQEA